MREHCQAARVISSAESSLLPHVLQARMRGHTDSEGFPGLRVGMVLSSASGWHPQNAGQGLITWAGDPRSSPSGTGGPWLLLSCYLVLLSHPRAGGGKCVEPSGMVVWGCTGIILSLLFLYLIVLKSYWCFKTILKCCSHSNTLLISTADSAVFTSWAEKEKFSLKEFIYKIKPTERNFIFQNAC